MSTDPSTSDGQAIRTLSGLPLHTRSLNITISRSRDSNRLWHARGDVVDLRKNGFVPSGYDIQPSGIIHSMSIDLEFDPTSLRIEAIEIDQPFIAVDPSDETEGECCRDPAPRLLDFKGDHLDEGFTKRLSQHFGGPLGCSHLLTLFQLMASTIPQGVVLETNRLEREATTPRDGEPFFRRSLFVDGHLRSDNRVDVAIQLADTHTRPLPKSGAFIERLASSHEWKLLAGIERKRFKIESLSAEERRREHDTLGSAPWRDHASLVAPLVDQAVIPGLAGRVFKLLPESPSESSEPTRAMLRDALLQLAPGFIQIVAALMDDYFEARATAGSGGRVSQAEVSSIGGNSNSCYMWREDSAISKAWSRERESTGAA